MQADLQLEEEQKEREARIKREEMERRRRETYEEMERTRITEMERLGLLPLPLRHEGNNVPRMMEEERRSASGPRGRNLFSLATTSLSLP